MSAVPQMEMDQVLDLVNHYAPRPRAAAQDESKGYRDLGAVLGDLASTFPASSEGALHAAAEDAYQVFLDAHTGHDVAPALNALLAAARPTPRLGPDGAVMWEVGDDGDPLRAALAIALLDWVHARGADRLGLCEGIRCADAFADSSAAGQRKYCGAVCLNRHKVAAYRRRAAEKKQDEHKTKHDENEKQQDREAGEKY
ncbi:CGNR zinc finger domain-containing protein [Georgenia yuyongxinii]|uniref:CGNR zinc finger domain-containing protein n=1 Tax=Georgenia yuyongxinii TaxID=2589797 RepID=UPI00143DC6C6|nr:CGNR zinc finger domain-containing protein [Georgenia yuyongxinii]